MVAKILIEYRKEGFKGKYVAVLNLSRRQETPNRSLLKLHDDIKCS